MNKQEEIEVYELSTSIVQLNDTDCMHSNGSVIYYRSL